MVLLLLLLPAVLFSVVSMLVALLYRPWLRRCWCLDWWRCHPWRCPGGGGVVAGCRSWCRWSRCCGSRSVVLLVVLSWVRSVCGVARGVVGVFGAVLLVVLLSMV